MNREAQIEHDRWSVLCEEAMASGIDPNKEKFNAVFRAIAMWGESLVALRLTQTPEQREKAAAMANERYRAVKKPKTRS
jgi:hypothetical protein